MNFESFSRFLEEVAFYSKRVCNEIDRDVLDGCYRRIGLSDQLGCESHLVANELRQFFKCYEYFLDYSLKKDRHSRFICYIFATNIYKEVMNEMGLSYTICKWNFVTFPFWRRGTLQSRGPGINITVTRGDRNWLSKGIFLENVTIDYANLYFSKRWFTARALTAAPRPYQDDPIRLSLHIIKYAYDLLTNYKNEGFKFVFNPNSLRKTMLVSEAYSIIKPDYAAEVCVFENGWSELRELRLFEHFLKETVQLTDLLILGRLPEDARLLTIALVYFSRKQANGSAVAACVLLSYVTLSVVLERYDRENLPRSPFPTRPVLDSSTDKDAVTADDCDIAAAIMTESGYLSLCRYVDPKLDREIVYPLEEFQYCLVHLNDLNALCGLPVPRTVFSRTYAGSLVFRLRCAVREAGDLRQFFRTLLGPAPTVLAFFNGLYEAYEEMLLSCQ